MVDSKTETKKINYIGITEETLYKESKKAVYYDSCSGPVTSTVWYKAKRLNGEVVAIRKRDGMLETRFPFEGGFTPLSEGTTSRREAYSTGSHYGRTGEGGDIIIITAGENEATISQVWTRRN